VATATRMLGGMLGVSQDEAADYFAAGLLHDIGKVVLALYMAEEFEDVGRLMDREGMPMYEAEMAVLGATHADVGAMLAVKWNLPVDLGDAIARHHTPDQGDRSQLVDCVFAADQISKKLCFGSSGNLAVQPLPAPVRARCGLDLDGLSAGMPTLDQEVGEARIFIRLGEAD
ncbi:MAG: HDOD domain-containing protein, partial [Proteobacteria bacterium]|nr:HDOD domain-containing protein [Pseudomonadota bacterium]